MKICAALFVLSCLSVVAGVCGASHDGTAPRASARFSRLASSIAAANDVVVVAENDSSPPRKGERRRRLLSKDNKGNKSDQTHTGESSKSAKSTPSSKSAKSTPSTKSDKSTKKSQKSTKKSNKSHKHKSPEKRQCTYRERDDSVQLKCYAQEAAIKDKIDFTLKTGKEGAVVQVKYKLDDKSDTDDVGAHHKIEEEYEIYFSSLVEYRPAGNMGELWEESLGFGWSDAETVQMIDLSKWKPFSDITKDDDGVLTFHVETKDGTVRLDFHLSQESLDGPRRNLSANHIKIDVTIANFDWKRDDTLLALLSRVEANAELETHYKKSDKNNKNKNNKSKNKSKAKHPTDVEINYGDGALPFGEFVWVTSADIGHSNKGGSEVVATSPPDHDIPPKHSAQGVQYIAFSFLDSSEADYIYWDPTMGVANSGASALAAATSTTGGNSGSGSSYTASSGMALFPRNNNGASVFGGFVYLALSVAGGCLLWW